MKTDYTIGVPVTANENNIVRPMLSSLERDLFTHPVGNIEVLMCLNNYDNETEEIIDNLESPYVKYRKIYSEPGLVSAQRAMIKEAESEDNFVLFYNSDTLIKEGSTKNMIDFMKNHRSVHAAAGDQHAANVDSFWYQVYNIIGSNPQLMTPRKYLTGRIFAIRKEDYFVPDFLVSDDTFLSGYLVDKFGKDAVQAVLGASVEYVGPNTLTDYYQKIRRLVLETNKIDDNFPNIKKTNSHFRKFRVPEEVEKLSKKEKFQLFLHDNLKKVCKGVASRSSKENVWVPLKSTKSLNLQ